MRIYFMCFDVDVNFNEANLNQRLDSISLSQRTTMRNVIAYSSVSTTDLMESAPHEAPQHTKSTISNRNRLRCK